MTPSKSAANELIHSTSPYLLQHAYNPVAWMPWGPAALERSKREDKPILVSIGYSSCHWCHVMERESFEQEAVAEIMNAYFICIKVDREERPDIDQVYMEAVQAMGGHGGWPLNVFLTPDQKPFYGGTYFPSGQWIQLLKQIHATFIQKRTELEQSAAELVTHLAVSDLHRFSKPDAPAFDEHDLTKMFAILSDRFDKAYGGLEKAPKFVMPSIWLFLLRFNHLTKNADALEMVRLTLIRMQQGGLYDRLGGGFARYSVDARWFAPHFEKMLYDNAQLISLYSEAWTVTQDPSFRLVVHETIGWLQREMRSPEGGFYSALDADSEGSEGKYYTWTYDELKEALGSDTEAVARWFNASASGNWEHGRNILTDISNRGIEPEPEEALRKLLAKRDTRVHPGLDDKILTGWNAMMIQGLTDAWSAFGNPEFLRLAQRCMEFLETNLMVNEKFFRSFKTRASTAEAFLEDYAFLIQAYTSLYQCTFDERYLRSARQWCAYTITHFYDADDGYFHFAGDQAEVLIARKKEVFDNVIPASNSVMARNLFRLGTMLGISHWKEMAEKMLKGLGDVVRSEPAYLSNWGILMTEVVNGLSEIVIVGEEALIRRNEIMARYLPFSVILGTNSHSELPLFEGRGVHGGATKIYVCFDNTCQLPVETTAEAWRQIMEK